MARSASRPRSSRPRSATGEWLQAAEPERGSLGGRGDGALDGVAEVDRRAHGGVRREGRLDQGLAVVGGHRRSTSSARSSALRAFDRRHLIVPEGAPRIRPISAIGRSST